MNKPVISFEKYEILNINYIKKENEDQSIEETDINTQVSLGISEGQESGVVEINVLVLDEIHNRTIEVKVRGYFIVNEDLDLEEIKIFLAQNGTAMLYPYVRSLVSMISSLDSATSILLPTINTSKTE